MMAKARKYAHRTEQLERNPSLNKNWFTRTFASVIVGGAGIHPAQWPHVRYGIFGAPILLLIFIINMIYDQNVPLYKRVIEILLITFFSAALPILAATAYGYWKRDSIDTTDSHKPDFAYLKRYSFLWVFIGVSASVGFGIFSSITGK